MTEAARQGDKLNVFISYSRDDLAFADQLDAALGLAGFDTTIDRHGISGGEEWKKRLGALIRDADTVVFVLSPSSARSKICAWEVEEAVRLGKRILPVLCRPLEGASPPPQLAALNYIFFYAEPKSPGSGFGTGLVQLASALNTDLDWLREHTRYLQRATEWDAGGRPANRLLSGPDIASAKAWAARRPKNAPEPTALQLDFIKASEAEDIRQTKRRGAAAAGVGGGARGEGEGAAARSEQAARAQQRTALLQESRALAIFAQQASKAGDHLTAMLLALEALPEPGFGGARPLSSDAAAALHQAWLRNRETALAGHRGAVDSASFSPDGAHVVTASEDGTARVWDLRGERPTFVALEGHQGSVFSASFSADGTHVVTASGTARRGCGICAASSRASSPSRGIRSPVVSASFSADGTHVVTASEDKTARVWDLRGERPSFVVLEGHQGTVGSAAFSADGTHVVTASYDKTARVWDLRGERPSFVALEGHQERSAPHRSAPTASMWSRRLRTRRRGCGICAASGELHRPRGASGRGPLRVVQPRRGACGHGVRGQDGAGVGFARGAAELRRA